MRTHTPVYGIWAGGALTQSIDALGTWLQEVKTAPELRFCILQYARSRGCGFMRDMCRGMGTEIDHLCRDQDKIGWRRFMEGMFVRDFREIQRRFYKAWGILRSSDQWAQDLCIKLLECTHAQWLYRNIIVHDRWSGTEVNLRKESLLQEIEAQLEMEEDLLEEDQYLLEINLGDIASSTGSRHAYWLGALKAARIAKQLAHPPSPSGIG